jgi:putative peptidoglycan lipid II flippase
MEGLRDTFSFSLRLLFFITIPAMAGLIIMSKPIMNVLWQRGEFTHESTIGAASALLFYATGIWAFSGLRVVRIAFYSLQDTMTPLKIAVLSFFVNLIFCFILSGPLQHGGLALANAIAAAVNFIILFFLLRGKLKRVGGRKIVMSFIKVAIASSVMGSIGLLVINIKKDIWTISGKLPEKAGILAGVIVLCIAVYFLIMYLLKSEELNYVIRMFKDRRSGSKA